MAVYFHNDKGNDYVNNWAGWGYVYVTARLAGWEPAGTRPDTRGLDFIDAYILRKDWNGSFFQKQVIVTAEDAQALATALETVLTHIPTAPPTKVFDDSNQILDAMLKIEAGQMPDSEKDDLRSRILNDWSNPEGRDHLSRLIDFCRQGEFKID